MKEKIIGLMFILCIFFVPSNVNADINVIDIKNIPNNNTLEPMLQSLSADLKFYHIWYPKWKFENPRSKYINDLKKLYIELGKIEKIHENIDLELLMGEVSQFLYNLEVNEYYQIAVDHYNKAEKINNLDYRPVWFHARHLSLSDNPIGGIEKFRKVIGSKDPEKLDPSFWEEYAFASSLAMMPSNALMGIDYARELFGEMSYFESIAGERIRKMIVPISNSQSVDGMEQWVKLPSEEKYINRLFGLRLDLAQGWKMKIMTGGKKIASSVLLTAPSVKGKKGMVTYSYSVIASLPEEKESLQTYSETFLNIYKDYKSSRISVNSQYKNALAYEIMIPSVYSAEGGAHLVLFFIEREEPKFPGTLLESPVVLSSGKDGLEYYKQKSVYARYKGKIYYTIVMDTCESVYPNSKTNLDELIKHMILIE